MPTRRRTLVHLAGVGAALAGPHAFALGQPETAAKAFVDSLPAQLQAAQVPGLSWALITGGGLLQTGAWGWADLATQRPMRAETLMGTASVTKTFTGALLLQLCEQGRCALDDEAQQHLPFTLRHPAHPQARLTLRHLLTHTSGLADEPGAYQASYACGDPRQALGDWLRNALHGQAAQAQPPFHAEAPGQRHAYSNVGYGLLGLVLEQLSGKTYAGHLRQALLEPLGMARSHLLLQGLDATTRARELATPYERLAPGQTLDATLDRLAQGDALPLGEGAGRQQGLCHFSFATMSDGLLRSSAPELARFAMALLRDGRPSTPAGGPRILRAETLDQAFSDQLAALPATARPASYRQGLTWRGLGQGVWAHFGSDPGTAAALALHPQQGRGIAMLANSSRARPLLGRLVGAWMAQG
jgi:CubicO group peptidase (beta-lactamase class C family)